MATLKIENLLCFERVELELSSGVTFISGSNSAGKSSLAMVLAALTAHEPNPLSLAVGARKCYVRDGQTEGLASLDDVSWSPVKGISCDTNSVAQSRPHCVGLIDFIKSAKSQKERAQLWEGLFLPENADEILKPAWSDRDPRQLATILDVIERQGWEAAVKIFEEKRRECKRRWREVTGNTYGKKVAASWVPDGWQPELENKSEVELQVDLTNAREELTMFTAVNAISEEQIAKAKDILAKDIPAIEEEMRALKAKGKPLKEQIDMAENHLAEYSERRDQLQKSIDKFSNDLTELVRKKNSVMNCPKCDAKLTVLGDELLLFSESNKIDEAIKDLTDRNLDARSALNDVMDSYHRCYDEIKPVNKQVDALREKFVALKGQRDLLLQQATDADKEPVELDDAKRAAIENAIKKAADSLDAFVAWKKAESENENIISLDDICDLLGPMGVRAKLMEEHMNKVRGVLAKITEITGWKPLKIGEDYSIFSGGRPVMLTASNERLKAQWAIQIAIGVLLKARYIILDNADILKGEHFEGLVSVLKRLVRKMPDTFFVVCGTDIEADDITRIRIEANHEVS